MQALIMKNLKLYLVHLYLGRYVKNKFLTGASSRLILMYESLIQYCLQKFFSKEKRLSEYSDLFSFTANSATCHICSR